jgi:hypothetical protein
MTASQSNDLLSLGLFDEGKEKIEKVNVSDDIRLKQLRANRV